MTETLLLERYTNINPKIALTEEEMGYLNWYLHTLEDHGLAKEGHDPNFTSVERFTKGYWVTIIGTDKPIFYSRETPEGKKDFTALRLSLNGWKLANTGWQKLGTK